MMCLHSQHVHMSLPNSVATEEGNWVPGGGSGGGTKLFLSNKTWSISLLFYYDILACNIFISRICLWLTMNCLFVFRSELSWFLKLAFVRGAFLSFFFSSTVLITFVTFLTYVLTDHILTAQKVFTCLSLFNSIRIVMTLFFPIAITFLNEGRVSIERIQVSWRLLLL